MRHLKIYENFKSPDEWQIGDVVVAITTKYAGNTYWLHEDYKYEIIDMKHDNTTLKVKEVGYQYSDENTPYNGESPILNAYFFKKDFITLEEWKLKQRADKYNL